MSSREMMMLLIVVTSLAGCSGAAPLEPQCELIEGFEGSCPGDMAFVPGTDCCIDRYEAMIDGDGVAQSKAGVLPTTQMTISEAEDSCAAAGKLLCRGDIWGEACTAGGERLYPYGDEFDPFACSGSDSTDELVPTGSLEGCEGGVDGVFDMSGNLLELTGHWEESPDVHRLRGGAYFSNEHMLLCSIEVMELHPEKSTGSGFRCCAPAEAR